jgi:PAS domain S-box-containing protein
MADADEHEPGVLACKDRHQLILMTATNSMNRDDIETAVGLAGKSIAVITAGCGLVALLMPRVRRSISAYCAAVDLSLTFGRDAGQVIRKLLVAQGSTLSQTAAITEAMSRAIHLGVYVCDSNGKNVGANSVLEQWFGMSKDRFAGHGWLSAIADEDRERAFRVWKLAVDEGIPYRDIYNVVNVETQRRFTAETEAVKISVEGSTLYVGFVRKVKL